MIGFTRAVSPQGRPCYMTKLGELGESRGVYPKVGQSAEAWRPYSHRVEVVTHVTWDDDNVTWIWFQNDNRWFPDGLAYPDSPFQWKAQQ